MPPHSFSMLLYSCVFTLGLLLDFTFGRGSGGYDPTGPRTGMPPHSSSMQLYYFVSTVEWRAWPYGGWYGCAPSLSFDAAVFSSSDGGTQGMILRGLVPLCPFTSSSLDGRGEGMTVWGPVRLCPLMLPFRYFCIISFGRWSGGYLRGQVRFCSLTPFRYCCIPSF